MAGRRFFQRGHASVAAPYLNTGSGGFLYWRPVLVVGAITLAGVAWWLLGHETNPSGGSITEAVTLSPDRSSKSFSEASSSPSFLNSALAKVQNASQNLVETSPGSSALQVRPLSDEALSRVAPLLGQAEARLVEIYRLISQGEQRAALAKADLLVRDHPNFQLAQLVHGDLLSVQMRPVRQLGDVPDTTARAAQAQLNILREESRRRLRALTERPPEGAIPEQFLALAPQSRHAIAVDASRSRLYLFENLTPSDTSAGGARAPQLRLLGDFYISVGLLGTEKSVEGDKRTPLGVYYITSSLNPDNLPDLYGIGALPINYPNPLDTQRGKTGGGIWLHGTPREQFVRAPQASDGCVVMSNPDLQRVLSTVQVRTTPVVIVPELKWVQPDAIHTARQPFEAALENWRSARSRGDVGQLKTLYSSRFQVPGRDLTQWWSRVGSELQTSDGPREVQLKDISMLSWRDTQDTMVVTFGEVALGQTRGTTRRQYWARERDQWKIFYEGNP